MSREVWWSVQRKMGGTWITEKSRIDDECEAIEFAEDLRLDPTFRVRVVRHKTDWYEVV